jgi:hypothetical protein
VRRGDAISVFPEKGHSQDSRVSSSTHSVGAQILQQSQQVFLVQA